MIPSEFINAFDSCVETENKSPRILQLTDMQMIDSTQRRYEERLSPSEMKEWLPEKAEENCLSHIRYLIEKTNPGLILITGDMVYGEFDDSGKIQKLFFNFIEDFRIPWAPIFGNHDNESAVGIDAQCDFLESLPHCLFKRGNVTGFGNYTVGLFSGGVPYRIIYMLDSHGCFWAHEERTKIKAHLAEDQLDFVSQTASLAEKLAGRKIPGIIAYHIPDSSFVDAATKKGYIGNGFGKIGVDFKSSDGDFGGIFETGSAFRAPDKYPEFLEKCGIDTVLNGHDHITNAVVTSGNVRYIFGTKTGTYDYHRDDMLGGTILYAGELPAVAEHIYYPVPEK